MLKKAPMKFDKELFKGTVLNNIKTLYRRTLEEATEQQIFQAVSYAIKDVVVDNSGWRLRKSTKKKIRRSSTICPWSS